MKRVLVLNGSPRLNGNTSHLAAAFMKGSVEAGADTQEMLVRELNLKYCTGCLRCNILRRCSLRDDNWAEVSERIMASDVLVIASPVYFHHVTAPMKILIDRFRSFVKVQITETGLLHTPHNVWNKDFVLILPMGSSDASDALPVIDLFQYMTKILGSGNRLHVITGKRLAMVNQVTLPAEELATLYSRLELPVHLAEADALKNHVLLENCFQLGKTLGKDGDSDLK